MRDVLKCESPKPKLLLRKEVICLMIPLLRLG
jgi:hypothetical protein